MPKNFKRGMNWDRAKKSMWVPKNKHVCRRKSIVVKLLCLCEIYCFSSCPCFLAIPMCYIPFERVF